MQEQEEVKDGKRIKKEVKSSVMFKQMTCSGECQVCMEIKDISYVIAPCGHDGYCFDCLTSLKKNKHQCPYCRGEIQNFIKLYTCRQERVEKQVVIVKEETKKPISEKDESSPS